MVAFSCCVFDGGEEEIQDMNAARERGWRGKFTKPGRVIRPGAIRINGKCPLTPLEVVSFNFVISIYFLWGYLIFFFCGFCFSNSFILRKLCLNTQICYVCSFKNQIGGICSLIYVQSIVVF